MYGVSRLDYSRLRELRYVALRAADRLDPAGRARLATATRGAKRWIELPFFRFQPSELGKVLLVVALSGFVVDRMRRMGRADDRADHAARADPDDARDGRARPRLRARLRRRHRSRCCSSPGAPWRHFAALGALFAVAIAIVARRRARGRRRGAQALPGGPPDVVPVAVRRSGRRGLPAAAVQDRHRLGREDRPRRGERHPDRPELPARAPHRLHLRGRRRDLRVRRLRARAFAVRAADMARAPHPHHREEPLRRAARRRHHRDAAVPALRERRDERGDHADHRRDRLHS